VAIKEASSSWRFPVTVSIGAACFTNHEDTIDTLMDRVELANKRAKDLGKDQVVLAD